MDTPKRSHVMEISLAGVRQLTDIGDIERILAQTQAQEAELESELDEMLRYGKSQLETKLELLEVLPTKLKPIHGQIKGLADTISETCGLAEQVSQKVRALDLTKGRVQVAADRVQLILDVKGCIEGIDGAMECEDWERACEYIKTYLSIVTKTAGEDAQQEPAVASGATVLDDSSNQLLRTKLEQLRAIIRKKADDSSDAAEVQRYCKLFTPLGMPNQGLRRYAAFVRSELKQETYVILTRLRKTINKKATKEESVSCIDAISMIFETVAHYAQEQSAVVEEAFGPGSTLLLLREIQQESDIHSTGVLKIFLEKFKVQEVLREIGQYRKVGGRYTANGTQTKKDPAELGEVLDAMAILSQRYELFERFLKKKAAAAIKALPEDPERKPQGLHHVLELNRMMQQIVDQYISLENYFMVENAAKAIKLDQSTPIDEHTTPVKTAVVDYIFFILQKCQRRALATYSPQCVAAVSNFVSQCLGQQLRDCLVAIMQNKQHGQGQAKPEALILTFIAGLNGLQEAVDYMLKVKVEADAEVKNIFAHEPTARDQALACITGISDTSAEYKKLLKANLEQLVAQRITPSLNGMIDVFRNTSYKINELKFAEYEINDPFAFEFVERMQKILNFYEPKMLRENLDNLIHTCLRGITAQLERAVLQKEFTQLGGLQFDKDLRSIVSYFSSASERTQVTEVLDYWGENSGQMTWRLTPGEVRRVLSRRIDFKPADIAGLKL